MEMFSISSLSAQRQTAGSPVCQEAGRAQVSAVAVMTAGWPQTGAGLGSEAVGSPGPGLLPGP